MLFTIDFETDINSNSKFKINSILFMDSEEFKDEIDHRVKMEENRTAYEDLLNRYLIGQYYYQNDIDTAFNSEEYKKFLAVFRKRLYEGRCLKTIIDNDIPRD